AKTRATPKRRQQHIPPNVGNKPKKRNDNNTMTMKFLLHKDKEENGKPSPQKQECGCPSLQPSLRSHTHAFFADPLTANNES
ncbi:MAG TPA: hypothetical protein PKH15_11280, partial [Bacteroidales bacterium]|nr:hypothetical protein [Bacteroidales bacterium]